MKLHGALGPKNEIALERLRRSLVVQPGFQLIWLEVPEGPIREQVVERVLSWSDDEIPHLHHLRALGRSETISRLVSDKGGIVLDDIDSALLDDETVDRFVGALNWQRDQLRKKIAGPLILVVSARGVARLFERAPDLSTWRSHTCRINRFANETFGENYIDHIVDSADPDSVELAQVESILARIVDRNVPPDEVSRVWVRIGRAHQRCGDFAQSRIALTNAADIATPNSDAYFQAYSYLITLDLKEGELEAAEQKLKAHELPMLHRGDSWTAAMWLSLKAAVSAAMGDGATSLVLAEKLVSMMSDRPELREKSKVALAATLRSTGRLEEAMLLLDGCFRADDPETRARAYLLAAKIERSRERLDLAIPLLRDGIASIRSLTELTDLYVEMTTQLSGLLVSVGDWAAARASFHSIEKELKDSPLPVRAFAMLNDGIGALELNDSDAVTVLERASKLAHGTSWEAPALFTLAIARLTVNDIEAARRAARAAELSARAAQRLDLIEWFRPYHQQLFDVAGSLMKEGSHRGKGHRGADSSSRRKKAKKRRR